MKSSIFSAIMILTAAIFVPLISCDLIETTCKQTPNTQLCLSILRSSPKSRNADITGLSLIMVEAVKGKVITTIEAINKMEKSKTLQPRFKKALTECRFRHDAILKADVIVAVEALQKGDPKFAVDGMNDSAIEAHVCEESFQIPKGSPLSTFNKDVIDTSLVAAAVIKNLL